MSAPAWLDELALRPGPPWLAMGTTLARPRWVAHRRRGPRRATSRARRPCSTRATPRCSRALDTPAVAAASRRGARARRRGHGRRRRPDRPPPARRRRPARAGGPLPHGAPRRRAAPRRRVAVLPLLLAARRQARPAAWPRCTSPVAHYAEELAAKVDTFLQRLRPERPVWRRNWSVHDDPSYFLPDPTPPRDVDAARRASSCAASARRCGGLTTAERRAVHDPHPAGARSPCWPSAPTSPAAWPTPSPAGPPSCARTRAPTAPSPPRRGSEPLIGIARSLGPCSDATRPADRRRRRAARPRRRCRSRSATT